MLKVLFDGPQNFFQVHILRQIYFTLSFFVKLLYNMIFMTWRKMWNVFLDNLEKEARQNQQKRSSLTFNLLQPDINDKIIRLDDSSGLSKQWNKTTNTDSSIHQFQHQHVSKSRVMGSNILDDNIKNEMTKEKNHRQYHLSKRKLLSILALHSSTESSTHPQSHLTSSNETHRHIIQLGNVNPKNNSYDKKLSSRKDSLRTLKRPAIFHPPDFTKVTILDSIILF